MSDKKFNIKFINLEKRKDRLEYFQNLMHKHNIHHYERFNAVDGSNLKITQNIIDIFRNNNFGWRRGVIGASLSHISLWNELVNSTYDYYIIFEDDIKLCEDFEQKLELVKSILTKNIYPFVLLGYTTNKEHMKRPSFIDKIIYEDGKEPDMLIYPAYQRQHIWGGIFAYIIHKDMASKILADISVNGVIEPIDIYILKHNGLYISYPILVNAEYMSYGNKVDSDIHYDLLTIFDDYHFFSELDSNGFDIKWIKPTTFEELKNAADEEENCVAFNTYGYLKSSVTHPDNFVKLPKCDSKIHGLYVRRDYLDKITKPIPTS